MQLKIVKSADFRINKKFKLTEKYIGNANNKIIIIEDFLKNPELIRNYGLEMSYIDEKNEKKYAQDTLTHWYTHRTSLFSDQYRDFFLWIINNHFGSIDNYQNDFMSTFQYYDRIVNSKPHVDPMLYSSVLCLNLKDELENTSSSTRFYRYKLTGEESVKYRTNIFNSPLDNFEIYHLEEHQFNKLIIYEASLLHNGFADYSKWDSKIKRFTLNFFY